jgi:hypothetical protein
MSYRERRPEFIAAWEAESQAVAMHTVEDVEARLRVLEAERVELIRLRNQLRRAARGVVSEATRPKSTIRSPSKKGRRDRRRPAK